MLGTLPSGAIEFSGNYTTAQTDVSLVSAPGTGKTIWLISLTVHSKVAGQIAMRNAAALVASHRYDLAANGGVTLGCGEVLTNWGQNKAVTMTSDITGNHMVRGYYYITG